MTFKNGDVVRLVSIATEPDYYVNYLGRVGLVIDADWTIDDDAGNSRPAPVVKGFLAEAPDEKRAPWLESLAPATEADLVYQRAMDELRR